jgi:GNAT superfamily N-acetyltransferase
MCPFKVRAATAFPAPISGVKRSSIEMLAGSDVPSARNRREREFAICNSAGMADRIFVDGDSIRIRFFERVDASRLADSFASHGWNKPVETFEGYLDEQRLGARACYVAEVGPAIAGYCTLLWESAYEPFKAAGIPEIADLNVLRPFRRHGVGSALLDTVEVAARQRSPVVGLGVGLYADYGAAQRLYVRRGYVPDGRGVMYEYRTVEPGQSIPIDDGATLMMTRALRD